MIRVIQGDITQQDADVVVNAANAHLAHGGGVAAAIARAAGPALDEGSRRWVRDHGPVGAGQAAITTAGNMPAGHVVHVVGPVYRAGQDNAGMLAAAVRAALEAAEGLGAKSIALPAISSGIFGYPVDEATQVIAATCSDWLDAHEGSLQDVRLVAFDAGTAAAFEAALST